MSPRAHRQRFELKCCFMATLTFMRAFSLRLLFFFSLSFFSDLFESTQEDEDQKEKKKEVLHAVQ